MKFRILIILAVLITGIAATASFLPPQGGGTWKIDAGDPTHDGKAWFKVKVKYTDPVTSQRKSKTINVALDPVLKSWDAATKAEKIKEGLEDSPDNDVGGEPLVDAGIGLPGSDVISVGASADNPGNGQEGTGATDIEIEDITNDDKKSREDDKVEEPAKNGPGVSAIAVVSLAGDITGVDADGNASALDLIVGSQLITHMFSGSNTRIQVAEILLGELRTRGIDAVIDRDRGLLIIVLTDSNPGVGVGSSDVGITVSSTVITAL